MYPLQGSNTFFLKFLFDIGKKVTIQKKPCFPNNDKIGNYSQIRMTHFFIVIGKDEWTLVGHKIIFWESNL